MAIAILLTSNIGRNLVPAKLREEMTGEAGGKGRTERIYLVEFPSGEARRLEMYFKEGENEKEKGKE